MSDSQLKVYSSPTLNKRTPEQAKVWLVEQATQGDQGAKDLLSVLFPDPNEHAKVSPRSTGKNREVS